MPSEIPRDAYHRLYGPTTGDRIRLADTDGNQFCIVAE